ncbi:ABC transporter substrate-binding protein [Aquincola tertiaricarbonis]|uniref:ABC transporter substrate-binding protein n=1 Tax=Aquincola tertiaricarbonis TaxID=391953 RepID=A0ABY4SCR5_AQUTE|nr:ABC transporter substrate-binding protein [Aquincola tertiaricarbonis]URI11123.1 ABC transporter substrate-binding protein [Aquincola tertiaricarbonis]
MILIKRRLSVLALALLASLPFSQAAAAADQPTVIRIGSPELGTGDKGFSGANPLSVVRARGWLEEEFRKDNIQVEWTFFRGAGPAVNEALAAKQLDVVFLGDLASVIGRSRGLPTRLIAVTGRGSNSYLATAPGLTLNRFADLKGRKVAVLKGTAYQRPFDNLLAEAGLTEKDLRLVNMDWPTAKAAVLNKDVDATFGGADLHQLQAKGVGLPFNTKGKGPAFTIHAATLATDDFIRKYPEVTTRLVKQLVRASAWASDEANRQPLLALWGEASGQGPAVFTSEFEGEDLRLRHSPLIDEAALVAYKGVAADALKLGLIKTSVDVDAWVAPQFVAEAVRQLKLDKFWPELDANGKARR